MVSVLKEKRSTFCFLGLLVALVGLSLSDTQMSISLPAASYIYFSGRIAWSDLGFALFLAGDLLFFTSLILLLEGKKLREMWFAQLGKAVLFTAAYLLLVQRVSGYTSFEGPGFGISLYLENMYTGMAQYIILISAFATLSLVVAGDFIVRRGAVEKPSERFYTTTGVFNFALGTVMVASILLTVSNYSFYPFPGGFYFYTQHLLFETVDAFEVIGVFTAALGCVIIAFKKNSPQIGRFQIVVGSVFMVLAAPLTFIPMQIWIDRYVFCSPLLASFDLKTHSNFPLNLNLFIYISLIIFVIGMLVYLRVSKLKTVATVSFLGYLYFYPGLRFSLHNIYNFPALTPSIPIPVYAGLALVLAVTAIPVVSQWNISSLVRSIFKPSVKTAALLIIAASLLFLLIFVNGVVAATAPMSLAHRGLSPEDRIDPYLLTLDPVPPSVPVILRFDEPISDENKTSLNNSGFFNISHIYEEEWKSYFAIFGSINTTGIDFQDTLRNLVNDFPLCYLLYNRDPSTPPDIINHYRDYNYVGADILKNWNITGRGVTIAIIDSGINDDYSEVKGKNTGRILYQVNFLTGLEGDPLIVGDITPEDSIWHGIWHGTWTACMIAGSRGIAPDANIIDLKVKTDNGELNYMTYAYTTEAVYWCIRNKNRFNISVIVLPIGCRDQLYGSLTEAVDRAFLNGIVVITGSGATDVTKRSIIGGMMTPGIADWAITVAATDGYVGDCWSPLSPLGPSPHWYFLKPELTTAYKYTSTSSSVVAGVALLLVQQCNEAGIPSVLRAAVIRWALLAGAQEYDLGPPGWDVQYGFGRVNALSSYLYLKNHLVL